MRQIGPPSSAASFSFESGGAEEVVLTDPCGHGLCRDAEDLCNFGCMEIPGMSKPYRHASFVRSFVRGFLEPFEHLVNR